MDGPGILKRHRLSLDTLRAWLATQYVVKFAGGEQVLTIGQTHPALDSVLDHRAWYLLTPYNPGGRQLGEAENRKRLAAMNMRLDQINATLHPAENRDPAGRWPTEAGFLVIGPDRHEAVAIARAFDQDGMVAGLPDAPAELWLIQADVPDPPPHVRRMCA